MSVDKCIAPNCDNLTTTGIPLPKQKDLQEKWLESLGISEFVPTSTSFVCLNHFTSGTNNIPLGTNDVLENALEELPIPVPLLSEVVPEQGLEAAVTVEETTASNEDEKIPVCRLCMKQSSINIDVFNKFHNNITIAAAIYKCIPEIKITKLDKLSQLICASCLEKIETFYNFRNECVKINIQQSKKRTAECSVQDISPFTRKRAKVDTINEKFDTVEAELMKALEGKLTDEMKNADNLIIQVQSDDENESKDTKLNVCVNDGNSVKIGETELKLPKDIKIKANKSNQAPSRSGNSSDVSISNQHYSAKIIHGVQKSEFCLVGEYLFAFRLSKGNVRHLKCIESKCRSTGIWQNNKGVAIRNTHNHEPPAQDAMKKAMFLHVMHRKMQSDRTLNFRNVYEEMCAEDPELKKIVPIKSVINQICSTQIKTKAPVIDSFQQLYDLIEDESMQNLHFTHTNKQFYQEKFTASDGSRAILFASRETILMLSGSKIMYVDASFKIESSDQFDYHLVTVLVWVSDSYYPILFALVSDKSQEIFNTIFAYLRDNLGPVLRPDEIITDYEAPLYYSLGETYLDSHIGGSVFYYTQNIYKKICSLNLSRRLETDSCFRNIYHMILMLPLLPVNTILDGLVNIEAQAAEMGLKDVIAPIFDYVKKEWMEKVTPDLFCVHRLENRINENVIAPFKKLRDYLMVSKGKMQKQQATIVTLVEKLIELEGFLETTYSAPTKRSFARDLSSSQKRNVIKAWQYIENHPKININTFFSKVLGYIKCMENQLWIWGFYGYADDASTDLINAANFSIINSNDNEEANHSVEYPASLISDNNTSTQNYDHIDYVYETESGEVVMDVVIDESTGGFLVGEQNNDDEATTKTDKDSEQF